MHDPVHVTAQVDPVEQETFAPSPTVTSQVDPCSQVMLHPWLQAPEHVLPIEQSNEQPCAAPHALALTSHVVPEGQVQSVPEHCAPPSPLLLHAAHTATRTRNRKKRDIDGLLCLRPRGATFWRLYHLAGTAAPSDDWSFVLARARCVLTVDSERPNS